MSGFRFGCGQSVAVFVPRGFGFRELTVRCGSTAHDGGVNQCAACEKLHGSQPMPDADEGDLEYDQRVHGGGE